MVEVDLVKPPTGALTIVGVVLAVEGVIRKAEFSWFALINETYPESMWKVNSYSTPTVIRPLVVKP